MEKEDVYDRGKMRSGEVRREQDVDFDSLIYGMAEGIADAQLKLDYNTAEAAALFGEIEVPIVPRVTRQIAPDGSVTSTYAEPENRTLLELGFTPTSYQFSEVQMDVEFDLRIHSDEQGETTLRSSTSEAHHNRKYQRDIDTTAKLSATLVPVPTPAGLSPAEAVDTTTTGSDEDGRQGTEDDGGTADTGDDGGTADTGDDDS